MNNSIGSFDLALGRVGSGISIVVLTNLILGMVLAVGQGSRASNIGWVVIVTVARSVWLVNRGVIGRITWNNVVTSIGSSNRLNNLLNWNNNFIFPCNNSCRDSFNSRGSLDCFDVIKTSSELNVKLTRNFRNGLRSRSRSISGRHFRLRLSNYRLDVGLLVINDSDGLLVNGKIGGGNPEAESVGDVVNALDDPCL